MAQKKKILKTALQSTVGAWLLGTLLIILVKMIWLTCRKTHHNPPHILKKQIPPQPVILTHWHEFIPFILMLSPPRISVLNSSHGDAKILGYASRFVGAKPIWGSSNRKPAAALRQLASEIKQGRHALITPDGPRGPYRKMAFGPVALAQLTHKPILLFACHANKAWRLKSWDKTLIPKPFSKIDIYWSDLLEVPRNKDKSEQAKYQKQIEAQLIALSEIADRGPHG